VGSEDLSCIWSPWSLRRQIASKFAGLLLCSCFAIRLLSKVLNDIREMVPDRDLLWAFLLAFAAFLALGCEFRLSRQHAAKDYIVVKLGDFRSIKHAGCIV
jgi:hypothetical protein